MKIDRETAKKLGLEFPGTRRTPRPEAQEKDTTRQALFVAACLAHGLPEPVAEYPWGEEVGRKWACDYLFEAHVIVEVVGGVWVRGHHSRGQSQIDDMERRNEAQLLGYVVLEFTPQQVEDGSAFAVIRRALTGG